MRPASYEEFDDVYLVFDFMESDLQKVIYSSAKISDDIVKYWMYQLLKTLKYLHSANILHRDLKPSNILVNSDCKIKVQYFFIQDNHVGL